MALAQDASESAIRLNKATAQTWLVFLASATERFFVPENRAGFLSDFMVRFEFTRSAFVKSAIAEDLFSKDAPHLQSMAQERFLFRALRTYDDRATSRVADVSSVVLRDMVLWAFMFVMAPNGRYLGEPDDAHSILFSLLKAPDDGLKGASLEVLADHLGWGASI
jgi:hypothetical protein